jgi:ERCC4-type nuclease
MIKKRHRLITKTKRLKKQFSKSVTILQDDREKLPFKFKCPYYKIERTRLKTGDYTIKGFEKLVCIERKKNWAELLSNLRGANRKRFIAELKRLRKFKHRYILIEDNNNTVLDGCKYSQYGPDTLYYWYLQIIVVYKIPIVFLGRKKDTQQMLLDSFMSQLLNLLTKDYEK